MRESARFIAALAGAGTGKTYSLVENYLCALLGLDKTGERKRPGEILALTFTQKAANEMRLRIAKRLSNFLSGHDRQDPLIVMAHELGIAFPSLEEIRRILRALPNAPIATFHGFCSSLLRKWSAEIGVDDRFEILSPRDELTIARNVLRPIIVAELSEQDSFIRSLVARFRLGNGPMSLGLIDGLLDLYFTLPEKSIQGDDLLRFAQQRAPSKDDLVEAIAQIEHALLEFFASKTTPSTLEKLHAIRISLEDFKTCLDHENESIWAKRFSAIKSAMKGNFGTPAVRTKLVAETIRLGAKLVDYFVADDERAVLRVLTNFHASFEQVKSAERLLSYGDLLTKTKEALFYNNALRKQVKHGITHVLIDEYQDTSPIQEDIIALLLESKLHEQSVSSSPIIHGLDFQQGPSLFVVGDKKQSIYGFRGADARLFDRMVHKMATTYQGDENFKKRMLQVNRRSKSRIITLVNLVAAHTLAPQGYSANQELVPLVNDSWGNCGLWIYDGPDTDKTQQNLTCATFGIAKLLERPDVSLNDIVVLVRRIKSAGVIKEKLAALGIPSRIVGGDGFFQQQEVVDVICALKLLLDPAHEFASSVVLRSPFALITDAEILSTSLLGEVSFQKAQQACEQGLFKPSSAERLQKFAQALKAAKSKLSENDLAAAIDTLLDHTDYAYAVGLAANAHQKWANIEKLRIVVARNTRNAYAAIDDFVNRIFEDRKEPLAEGRIAADAVTLMTIHQSKGLEFRIVVVADGESPLPVNHGDFLAHHNLGIAVRPRNRAIAVCGPNSLEREHAETRYDKIRSEVSLLEKDELARLLYVALTRARDELYVVTSRDSFQAKTTTASLVGLFLDAWRSAPETFLAVCDVMPIDDRVTKRQGEVVPAISDNVLLFEKGARPLRLFASSLKAMENSPLQTFINADATSARRAIDGNLAHKLIAQVGNDIAFDAHNVDINALINAAFRSMGTPVDHLTKPTTVAVKKTLFKLQPLIQSSNIMFEMPLFCRPNSAVMIEGFADLVVEHDDFVGVVEFKSSLQQVLNPNTFFQVLAYAHALRSLSHKPTKFAVICVGSSDEICWHTYDDHAQEIFLSALHQHCLPARISES